MTTRANGASEATPVDLYAFGSHAAPQEPRIDGYNMIDQRPSGTDWQLWQHVVQAERELVAARANLVAKSSSIIPLVRAGLHNPSERSAALNVAAALGVEQRVQLFDVLLSLASSGHGLIGDVRRVILSLPHEWLLAHIESYAEPLLQLEDDEEYRRLLELYSLIDRDLTLRLARRAAAHSDPDVKEAGEDFLANPDPFGVLPAA